MKIERILIILVVLLASILRLVSLTENPPSLNWDEVSHGYNAYSILKTGKDEWGQPFPVTNFRAYGDYPLPLNLYLTIPFIWGLGLNELSIRLPHALLGILTVIASYFLVVGITDRKGLGLLTAFLVAVEPWHLFPSRFVLQSNLSVFFLTAGAAAFFNRQKHKYLLPLSLLLFGLTVFSYHSTRIFTPLLLLALLLTYKDEWVKVFKKEKLIAALSIGILVLFFLPLPLILANPEARARAGVVFLINEGAVNQIIESRQASGLPPALSGLVYNRPTYFTFRFLQNYFDYFSPRLLFFEGGTHYQFSIPDRGLLYPINLPFFYLGLALLLSNVLRGKKRWRLLLAWLLLAPIPASATTEEFAVIRSTTLLPLPQLLTAIGLYSAWRWAERRFKLKRWAVAALALYIALLAGLTENYLTEYFGSYKREYSWSWQYGYKEVVAYVKEHYGQYDNIIITKKYGEPHEFFLFYGAAMNAPWPWSPEDYRSDPNLIRFEQSDWYWVDRFDKLYFVNDWEIPKEVGRPFVLESGGFVDCDPEDCLLVTSPGNYPPVFDKLETIHFLDGKPAFEILGT